MSASYRRKAAGGITLPNRYPQMVWDNVAGVRTTADFGYDDDGEAAVLFTEHFDDHTHEVIVPRGILVVAYLDGWLGEHSSDAVRAILGSEQYPER